MHTTSLLVLGGNFGTGKSTVARELAERTGGLVVEIGEVIRARLARRAGQSILDYIDEVVRSGDRTTWVREADCLATGHAPAVAIIVGVRMPEEIAYLRRRHPSCLVVALTAPEDVRRTRWRHREAPEIPTTYFDLRAGKETEWGLDASVALADFVVNADRPAGAVAADVLRCWQPARGSH